MAETLILIIFKLKTKEGVVGSGLELHGGGKQLGMEATKANVW